jgi:hypothetical protein
MLDLILNLDPKLNLALASFVENQHHISTTGNVMGSGFAQLLVL